MCILQDVMKDGPHKDGKFEINEFISAVQGKALNKW